MCLIEFLHVFTEYASFSMKCSTLWGKRSTLHSDFASCGLAEIKIQRIPEVPCSSGTCTHISTNDLLQRKAIMANHDCIALAVPCQSANLGSAENAVFKLFKPLLYHCSLHTSPNQLLRPYQKFPSLAEAGPMNPLHSPGSNRQQLHVKLKR
jgi:hypothetical protein